MRKDAWLSILILMKLHWPCTRMKGQPIELGFFLVRD